MLIPQGRANSTGMKQAERLRESTVTQQAFCHQKVTITSSATGSLSSPSEVTFTFCCCSGVHDSDTMEARERSWA